MTEPTRQLLREVLLLDYDDLKAQLTKRLGSAELASDVLQDTWVRLEQATSIGPVERPRPYLLRMAHNIALKRLKAEPKTITLDGARVALGSRNQIRSLPTGEAGAKPETEHSRLPLLGRYRNLGKCRQDLG